MPSPYLLFGLLVESGATQLNAVIAGLAFLNTLGIFGLIYHVGRFVGDNSRRWLDAEKRLLDLDVALKAVHTQEVIQTKNDAVMASIKTTLEEFKTEMRAEVKLLRRRSHDLANLISRLVLEGGASLSPVIKELATDRDGEADA